MANPRLKTAVEQAVSAVQAAGMTVTDTDTELLLAAVDCGMVKGRGSNLVQKLAVALATMLHNHQLTLISEELDRRSSASATTETPSEDSVSPRRRSRSAG